MAVSAAALRIEVVDQRVALPGKWDARADAEYFRAWIDDLIAQRRDPVLTPIYAEARERYAR